MYHTEIKNQVPKINKSFLTTSFSPKDLQTGYIGDIEAYISTCTPFEQDIAHYILQFRYAPWTIFVNETIAKEIGCSTRTVIRTTNKFHKDGFVTKRQSHQYSANNYTLNDKVKKGKHAFSYWINSLSPKNKDLYISHGIKIDHKNKKVCSDVTPNNSSLILDSLFSRNVLSSRAGARLTTKKQKTSYQKKGKIVNSVQKQLILDNRHDPLVKEMINNPTIMSYIITPTIQKITTLLTLDEKEQFKLTAFTEDTLHHTHEKLEKAIGGRKITYIPNKMEWLIAIATEHCNDNDIKPDWKWYYDLCDIIGIDSRTDPKPMIIKKAKRYTQGYSSEIHKPELPFEQQRAELIKEIENCKIKLADPSLYFKFCLKESIVYTEKRLAECLRDLESLNTLKKHIDRESSNEKQSVSYQYNSDTMAACSA